ncbi:rhodanese-like domain-containing protein [Glaciecola sp. SC05]|uniref:rhodanese-like domain-containing protein n=1 Tax=Glaciecola sp. SC05 TaxID=1987355 RepID=UPI003527965E
MLYKEVTAQQAKQILEAENAILIDVREPAEHASKHIPQSLLHPVGKISDADIKDKQQTLMIYCQKGMRGKKACEKLTSENAELKVFNIIGGIEAWESAGLTTQSTGAKLMPLDRQVQVSIGVLLVVFSLLSLFVSNSFGWATAFIGVGLFIAGSTGFCGLGRIIAMMPWNQRT